MADPLHYETVHYETVHYQPAAERQASTAWWPAAIVAAVACVVAAGCAWSRSMPALGERSLPSVKIWAAWCTAASLWMAAQAVLLGVALPAIYRARPMYSRLAAVCGLFATLSAVSAAALWLAGR